VAATEPKSMSPLLGSIVAAACALPGVMPTQAWAEDAPELGVISFKLSGYRDAQLGQGGRPGTAGAASERASALSAKLIGDGQSLSTISRASGGGFGGLGGGGENSFERIHVTSPSVYALVPLGRQWAAEGSLTVDDVSGASPAYYTDMKGASNMVDRRKAGDLKLTHYAGRQTYALGLSHSKESDYLSNAVSAEARFSSEDQNTTFNVGLGLTRDTIDPTTKIVSNEKKRTTEAQFGITQALSPIDLVQASFTFSRANGYLNDPYKLNDDRPRNRNAEVLQLRWNHWFGGSALKLAYRLYHDSFSVLAHTIDLGLAIPFSPTFTITPAFRYYTQSAANFYADPSALAAVYPGPVGTPAYFSADQRLSAFGAITGGMKAEWRVASDWTLDAKFDFYQQKSSYRLIGHGSPGLNTLNAGMWQLGLSHSF